MCDFRPLDFSHRHNNLFLLVSIRLSEEIPLDMLQRISLSTLILLIVSAVGFSVGRSAKTPQQLVDEAARTALEKFKGKGLKEENLSITLIDLRDPEHPVKGSFRGNER